MNYTKTLNSKPITLEQLAELSRTLEAMPPIITKMEMSEVAITILKRNIGDLKDIGTMFGNGIPVYLVNDDKELGVNKVRFIFDKGEPKIMTVFNFNYDFKYNFTKELFK